MTLDHDHDAATPANKIRNHLRDHHDRNVSGRTATIVYQLLHCRLHGHVIPEHQEWQCNQLKQNKTFCSQPGCLAFHVSDYWSTLRSDREGWFHQRNGDAWCARHTPAWVLEWRAKQESKDEG